MREISAMKGEPDWMTRFRLRALKLFESKPMPQWGGDLNGIDFGDIFYYVRASDKNSTSWDDVPAEVKNTFDRPGHPRSREEVPCRRGRSVQVRGDLPLPARRP